MTDTETPWPDGPWAWRNFGRAWMLVTAHSGAKVVLDGDTDGNIVVRNEKGLLEPITPEHPLAAFFEASVEQDAANRKAREALEPFGNEELMAQIADDEDDEEWAKFRLLIKNYRAAAEAIAELDRVAAKARGQ